jgi:hypothetical protein
MRARIKLLIPNLTDNDLLFTFCVSMRLSQTHTGPPAILIDEIDAGGLHSAFNYLESCSTRFAQPRLDLTNGDDSNSGSVCKLLLGPIEESSSCPALRRSDHHLES